MIKIIVTFIYIFSLHCFLSFAQNEYNWIEKVNYSIDSSDVWTVDLLGNMYITKKELIQKNDSIGKLKFLQSQKSSGRITSIQTINTMKLIVFSEEQQNVCFLDNTLTPYEACIDFQDLNISNATKIAVSSQSDKFWVYDQLNSRLHLIALNQTNQSQEIENLNGLLNSSQLSYIFEYNNYLYLVDTSKGVFVLDMYGSLVNFLNQKNITFFQVDMQNYYFLRNNNLQIINTETKDEIMIPCPLANTIEFRKIGNSYYFRTQKEIKKYDLLFVK